MSGFRRCNRCVMSESGDSTIHFDENGYCNYCTDALDTKDFVYFPGLNYYEKLTNIFNKVKKYGKGRKYDCMLGLSGGLDSSYLALLGHRYGLRMLAVHVDDGFDNPITTSNIKKLCNSCNIDLIVEKPDNKIVCDLVRSFILAGVPNIAIPQDNVLFACLYRYAKKNKIKYFLNGGNFALESILQKGNTYDASDKIHIIDIHKRFGEYNLPKDFPLFSVFEKRIIFQYIYRIKFLRPLNFIEYNQKKAFQELNEFCGFEYYGDKHCESVFTKFMQRYYLPVKFGVDKRTSHYSSMIISDQMTREEALNKLQTPLYERSDLKKDLEIILISLNITNEDFEIIMKALPQKHEAYKISSINRIVKIMLRIRRELFKR